MKVRRAAIVLFALMLVGSAAPIARTSTADLTEFTSIEAFDPFGLFGPPVGVILSTGSIACPDSQPTADPTLPCPLGSRVHVRGLRKVSRVESSDPRMTGWNTSEANGNLAADYTGPAWGTFSIALDSGGRWDGIWEGRRLREGDHWVLSLRASAQGTQGAVEGMQLLLSEQIVIYTPLPIAYFGTTEGRIFVSK